MMGLRKISATHCNTPECAATHCNTDAYTHAEDSDDGSEEELSSEGMDSDEMEVRRV